MIIIIKIRWSDPALPEPPPNPPSLNPVGPASIPIGDVTVFAVLYSLLVGFILLVVLELLYISCGITIAPPSTPYLLCGVVAGDDCIAEDAIVS